MSVVVFHARDATLPVVTGTITDYRAQISGAIGDRTPREIIQQLNADIVKIINAPDVKELLLKQGAESYATSPEEFAKVVQRDVAKWAIVVKSSGAKAD